MKELIKKYCDDFYNKKHCKLVGDNFIPIVWFGNLNQYQKSKTKIVTVSINPSFHEFEGGRFKDEKIIREEIDKKEYPIDLMIQNFNDYFKVNPYMKWFSAYERQLNEINCSYFDNNKENTAIHIDLCTAIATNPTWGKLPKDVQSFLMNKSLLVELLDNLSPEIVLVSVAKDNFIDIVKPEKIVAKWEYDNDPKNCKRMILYQKGTTKYLFGRNMNGIPFNACKITKDIIDKLFL